jgi:hypothetical protein
MPHRGAAIDRIDITIGHFQFAEMRQTTIFGISKNDK